MIKKIFLSFLLLVILFSSIFTKTVHAQAGGGNWYAPTFGEFTSKVFGSPDSEIFGERYTMAQVFWIFHSIPHLFIGSELAHCVIDPNIVECVKDISEIGQINGPIFGLAGITDTLLQTKPASGIRYLSNTASGVHIIPEVYAQGAGFNSLEPVIKIWRVFRNMAYFLMIIAILIMAFLIMFRVKISPQTVITIQSALPKIAVTLLLITFSYAIAGLLIDLSYLLIAIVATFAKSGGLAGNLTPSLSALELAQQMWGGFAHPILSLTIPIVLILTILMFGGGALVGAAAGTVVLPVIGTVGAGGLGLAIGAVVGIVGIVAIAIALVRVLWTMIKSMVTILMLVIFGPLILLMGAVSPTFGGFGVWIKSLLSNIVVFPTIAIMAFLGHLFFWGGDTGFLNFLRESGLLNPFQIGPVLGTSGISLPLFSGGITLISTVVGFGILLLMPSAADLIKSLIQGQPFTYGTAIGQAFAPFGKMWGMTGGPVADTYKRYGADSMTHSILTAIKGSKLPSKITSGAEAILQRMDK